MATRKKHQPIKIVVPSHRRPDLLTTHKSVDIDCVCIPESQLDEYRRYNPQLEYVCHPDSVIGLPAKRDWMYKHFGNLWMFDDDVFGIQRNWPGIVKTHPMRVSPTDVRCIVANLFEMAEDIDAYLIGFGSVFRPQGYQPFKPFRFSGNVIGGGYGIRAGSGLYWNHRMKSKEDYWISCLNAVKHRKCVLDLRYFTATHECFVRPGGLTGQRTERNEEVDFQRLEYVFGEENFERRVAKQGKNRQGFDTLRSVASRQYRSPF